MPREGTGHVPEGQRSEAGPWAPTLGKTSEAGPRAPKSPVSRGPWGEGSPQPDRDLATCFPSGLDPEATLAGQAHLAGKAEAVKA